MSPSVADVVGCMWAGAARQSGSSHFASGAPAREKDIHSWNAILEKDFPPNTTLSATLSRWGNPQKASSRLLNAWAAS